LPIRAANSLNASPAITTSALAMLLGQVVWSVKSLDQPFQGVRNSI